MGRADQGTVIHASLLVMLTTGSRQFVEQHLCVLQIGGVEALGELAVNGRQQLARFGPPALFGPQLGEGSSQARNSHDFACCCLAIPSALRKLVSARCSSGVSSCSCSSPSSRVQLGFVIHDAGLRDVVERLR